MDRSGAPSHATRSAAGRLRPAALRLSIALALLTSTATAAELSGTAQYQPFVGFESMLAKTRYSSLSPFNSRRIEALRSVAPNWQSPACARTDAYGRPLGGEPSLLDEPERNWTQGGRRSAVRLTSVSQPVADGEAAQTPAAAGTGEPQTYGEKPVDNTLEFLRRQSVLLKRGEYQFDTGVAFTNFDYQFPLVVGPNAAREDLRQRLLYSPFALRYGLTDRIQFYSFLPVGWANGQSSIVGSSVSTNLGGLGDFTGGLNMKLREGEGSCPEVIGTFGFTAPTGVFSSPIFATVPGAGLGQGMWALNGQLLFINVYDPVVLFYGAGYRHLFQRDFSGTLYQAGEQFNYQMGVGFAVNERVTLSTAFQGYYITNTYLNDVRIQGTNIEPMSLRFAVTITRPHKIVEPFAQIGMTEFAPRASIGIVMTYY